MRRGSETRKAVCWAPPRLVGSGRRPAAPTRGKRFGSLYRRMRRYSFLFLILRVWNQRRRLRWLHQTREIPYQTYGKFLVQNLPSCSWQFLSCYAFEKSTQSWCRRCCFYIDTPRGYLQQRPRKCAGLCPQRLQDLAKLMVASLFSSSIWGRDRPRKRDLKRKDFRSKNKNLKSIVGDFYMEILMQFW